MHFSIVQLASNGRLAVPRLLAPRIAAVIAVVCALGGAAAAEEPKRLSVVVSPIEPCVQLQGERFGGFEVELLRRIGERIGVEMRFRAVKTLREVFDSLERQEADLAAAGLTITRDREKRVDFSHPTLAAGYSILVRRRMASTFLSDLWAFATQPHLGTLLGVFLLFLVLCAHIAWFAERGNTEAINDRYFPGVFEALWFVWVSSTTVGYGDIAPKRWGGRLAASLIMLVGIGFAGILISELSSFRVTDRLASKIHGPRDLVGKRVATKSESSSVQLLEALQARVVTFPTMEAAYDALAAEQVTAVVFDTPVVVHFAKRAGKERKLAIAGPPFRRQSYGLALPPGSAWRERINSALLGMLEDGSYEQLHQRYFGSGW